MSDQAPTKVKASQHESYGTFTILSLLIPPVGILMGAIFMTKDGKLERKLGEHMLAISVLFIILYGVIWAVLVSANAANQAVTPY